MRESRIRTESDQRCKLLLRDGTTRALWVKAASPCARRLVHVGTPSDHHHRRAFVTRIVAIAKRSRLDELLVVVVVENELNSHRSFSLQLLADWETRPSGSDDVPGAMVNDAGSALTSLRNVSAGGFLDEWRPKPNELAKVEYWTV
ncbi:hypothetical protein Q1695_004228 [Nippostrongylus brasiliensis]|nr:hypothetical protein Q1695_004228 [Nippostrongylus brasiliensis]